MQLAAFRNREGFLADTFAMEMERDSPACQWCQMNGAHCPELCKVARIVLAMVSSVGACERNWSAHDVIQTKKRNRLDPKREVDLVYLYCKLRLINNMRADELFAEWDEE
ncbi:g5414 [Coccomyxa elongata]